MQRVVFIALFILAGSTVFAQNRNLSASITASSTDCSVANSCVTFPKSANDAGLAVVVKGTYTGTLQFEGTNGTTWSGLTGQPFISGTGVNSTTSTGAWLFATTGLTGFRVRASAYTSGTATIDIQAGSMPPGGSGSGGGGGGGTSSNFGNAFPAAGTAAGFIDASGNMAGANLDGSGNLKVAGTFSPGAPADTVGTTTALNANGVTASVAAAGQQGITVHFDSAGNLVGTVVPEVSMDGGTTWSVAVFTSFNTASVIGQFSSLANPSGDYSISYAGPITHARVRVSAYTSGSTNTTLRAVATQGFRALYGWNSTTSNYQAITVGNSGRAWTEIRDAAGNARGVNVNASNQLSVSVDNTPTVTANAGSGTFNIQTNASVNVAQVAGAPIATAASGIAKVGLTDGSGNAITSTASALDVSLATGSNTIGKVDQGAPATGANAWPIVLASLDYAALAEITNAFKKAPLRLAGNLGPIQPIGNALPVTIAYPAPVNDPCQGPKGFLAISQALSAQVVTANPGYTTYVCGIVAVGADAENLSLVYGTGAVCATGITAMIGGSTANNGMNLAANGGWVQGWANSSIAKVPPGQNVCLIQSGTGRVAGNIAIVYSP